MTAWNDATHEYKFDTVITAAVVITASSLDEARRILANHGENLPTDLYIRPHVKMASVQLNPDLITLFEVDGKTVDPDGVPYGETDQRPASFESTLPNDVWVNESAETLAEVRERHNARRS